MRINENKMIVFEHLLEAQVEAEASSAKDPGVPSSIKHVDENDDDDDEDDDDEKAGVDKVEMREIE